MTVYRAFQLEGFELSIVLLKIVQFLVFVFPPSFFLILLANLLALLYIAL